MDFARAKPVRAECDGVPVYGYGYTYIYGISPDFTESQRLQQGNEAPLRKIQPKKSWEIESNMLGVSPPRMPRTDLMDFQPQLGIRLIDGDPDTFWCSRSQNRPDVEPAWIRIDLAKEGLIKAVILAPREDRKGIPEDLTIKLSRDAWHWETVYEGHAVEAPAGTEPLVFSFEPVRAKQIWIISRKLSAVYHGLYFFSMAEVEVIVAQAGGEDHQGGSA